MKIPNGINAWLLLAGAGIIVAIVILAVLFISLDSKLNNITGSQDVILINETEKQCIFWIDSSAYKNIFQFYVDCSFANPRYSATVISFSEMCFDLGGYLPDEQTCILQAVPHFMKVWRDGGKKAQSYEEFQSGYLEIVKTSLQLTDEKTPQG